MKKPKKEEEDGWWGFCQLIPVAAKKNLLEELFDCFLTHEEKRMLSSRFIIIEELLKEKLTQREIAAQHGVSIAQITRGSNQLKTLPPSLKELLHKFMCNSP